MNALLAALLLTTSPPAQPAPPSPPPADPAVAAAKAALGPFKAELKQALTDGLAKGPVSAIDVCSAQAPKLAEKHSKAGVRVGRAALKLRNPANAAPAWAAPLLAELSKVEGQPDTFRTAALPGGGTGYVEPIWLGPQCVVCHGATLAPDVQAAIGARYPKDAATGFAPGQLRGVFWAELPKR